MNKREEFTEINEYKFTYLYSVPFEGITLDQIKYLRSLKNLQHTIRFHQNIVDKTIDVYKKQTVGTNKCVLDDDVDKIIEMALVNGFIKENPYKVK